MINVIRLYTSVNMSHNNRKTIINNIKYDDNNIVVRLHYHRIDAISLLKNRSFKK